MAIHVDVVNSVDSVKLHCRELFLRSVTFKSDADTTFSTPVTGMSFDTVHHVVELKFGKALPCGKGRIIISYTGEHNNQMAGFYRSTYKDINGQEKVMVTTQCEAIDARRVLPCWDEVVTFYFVVILLECFLFLYFFIYFAFINYYEIMFEGMWDRFFVRENYYWEYNEYTERGHTTLLYFLFASSTAHSATLTSPQPRQHLE